MRINLLGDDRVAALVVVQVPGAALGVWADVLRDEASRGGPLSRLLLLYARARLTETIQSVACNGLHSVRQRCCRWLATTHDRVQSGVLPLTHGLLAQMLGVRRPSVSEALRAVQGEGLIRSRRGKITILNRAGLEAACCECYRRANEEYERPFG